MHRICLTFCTCDEQMSEYRERHAIEQRKVMWKTEQSPEEALNPTFDFDLGQTLWHDIGFRGFALIN